ncbi:MAG: lipoyl(octanoyl) transferase LipB [Nitrospiraceae bacterium]
MNTRTPSCSIASRRMLASLRLYDSLPYADAWNVQQALLAERAQDRCFDTLLLLEHEPVITLGRSTKEIHWNGQEQALRAQGFPIYHVERGGSITYHGPGQVVGYPIVRLQHYCSGPKAYMKMLEEVLIRTLSDWGLTGYRMDKFPGVWVQQGIPAKIAAMGVRITQGITMHGFALNVQPDLEPFRRIVPCGIAGCQVTSMAAILSQSVDMSAVKQRIAHHFAEVFGIRWTHLVNDTPPVAAGTRDCIPRGVPMTFVQRGQL